MFEIMTWLLYAILVFSGMCSQIPSSLMW